jgi:hypothetical protein
MKLSWSNSYSLSDLLISRIRSLVSSSSVGTRCGLNESLRMPEVQVVGTIATKAEYLHNFLSSTLRAIIH